MDMKYIYRDAASQGKPAGLCVEVENVSASGWCWRFHGEAITEPQQQMTLDGAKSAAVASLNQRLSKCGVPQINPFSVEWRVEEPSERPWEKRKTPALGHRAATKEPHLGGRKRL
jgi:hypothetical protein